MDLTDAALVGRALGGDAAAYEQLVRRFRRAAYAIALAVTTHTEDAEDVCQDAFVQAHRTLASCRSPERFGRWLLQIVRNLARNHRRYLRRRPATSIELTPPIAGPDSPAADLERAELRGRLLNALRQIPSVQREIVLLHDLDDWRHATIAAALGISEVMSRRHLSDARRTLRNILRETDAPERASD